MNSLTVSILVPVYGVEKYIAECAESLFGQTYSDIRYVFCDDCTPDISMDILKAILSKYPERKDAVRIVKNELNLGLGGTRAQLARCIDSQFFMIVDSDDRLPLDAIENLVRTMTIADTDIVEGAYIEIQDDNTVGRTHYPFHGSEMKYKKRVLCDNIESHQVWGKLYKSSVLGKISDLFIEGINMAEDYCATARLADCCSRSWTDNVVYEYRVDNMTAYTKTISEKDVLSYCAACNVINSYYLHRKKVSIQLEIGVLNAFRQSRLASVSGEKVASVLPFVPQYHISKILLRMFNGSECSFKVANIIYKLIRSIVSL